MPTQRKKKKQIKRASKKGDNANMWGEWRVATGGLFCHLGPVYPSTLLVCLTAKKPSELLARYFGTDGHGFQRASFGVLL